ncbi:tRNA-dihydrouridine(47) synthase [NAD(P)(+)]-like [Asterias amurensis]|uniref:tRNA-dihydrouridine(47) synthase [NAD(P)(+)]-like n=1 Tax=Asterias amurensis TaxID=7602 RepID=UPI003AB5CBF7
MENVGTASDTMEEETKSGSSVTLTTEDGPKEAAAQVEKNSDERPLSEEDKQKLAKMLNERQGNAKIKSEYINYSKVHLRYGLVLSDDQAPRKAETASRPAESRDEPKSKRQKKARGMNQNRPRTRWIPVGEKLCPKVINGQECQYGDECRYLHDLKAAGAKRLPDIGDRCYNFETFGKCHFGVLCRFGSCHLTKDFENVVENEKYEANLNKSTTSNSLSIDLKVKLRKRRGTFERSDKFLAQLSNQKKNPRKQVGDKADVNTGAMKSTTGSNSSSLVPELSNEDGKSSMNIHQHETANQSQVVAAEKETTNQSSEDPGVSLVTPPATANQAVDSIAESNKHSSSGVVTDQDLVKLRKSEKKKLNVEGKSYLAPLTTVGNLPFRRVCKRLGADITCGEMAMSTNLLQGQPSEWALLKRHSSEDVFGVQLAGYFPDTVSRCSELVNTYCDVDFVDLNVGCPIDLVYMKGGGSALMGRTGKLEEIVRGMDAVLDVPVTVKMRAGISDKNYFAHKLIPKVFDWGASVVTLHGRSREQRYTRSADWAYIKECVDAAKPHPVIGNGDILSYEDMTAHLENSGAAGVMIARGALIKPWLFTEIKEQRHWDISANERLDILREYTNYGLEHWGSDTEGLEKTRRFLLEWLSFLHRYIPVGILERLPQKIQERPPFYVGRNDLETLMSSTNCNDWVKISEMLLGPIPDSFLFLPKHKANSYS